MKSFFKIPFPRPALSSYLTIALMVGLTIAFILIVFQPFGTAQFQHSYKLLILAGYGITVTLVLQVYYFLSIKIIHFKSEDNWNIVFEVLDLSLAVILSLLATYLYSMLVFGGQFNLIHMAHFLLNAGAIALIPVLVTLFSLYVRWHDVKRSRLEMESTLPSSKAQLILLGHNKTDIVKTSLDQLYLAKAQDNYVLLFLERNGQPERHMIRSTLKQVEEQLDMKHFKRSHRSYIVNTQKLRNIIGNKSKASLVLEDQQKIPLSRNYYDDFKNLLNN